MNPPGSSLFNAQPTTNYCYLFIYPGWVLSSPVSPPVIISHPIVLHTGPNKHIRQTPTTDIAWCDEMDRSLSASPTDIFFAPCGRLGSPGVNILSLRIALPRFDVRRCPGWHIPSQHSFISHLNSSPGAVKGDPSSTHQSRIPSIHCAYYYH